VDDSGKTVLLRGVNAGGTFLVEPWMSALNLGSAPSGFPQIQDEVTLWQVLNQRFGPGQTQQLQHTWRTAWFGPSDISILASLGVNVVRIGFFYQLLQDDSNPGSLKPEGLALLNSLLDACAQYGVYAILDLHGAPGGQSNNFTTGQAGLNQLFRSAAYQQQTIQLWSLLAAYYQNRSEVAGYDLINEPTSATVAQLIDLHNRIYQAIRAVDQRHMIIMEDGYNGFSAFPDPQKMGWSNICYSLHLYHLLALGANAFQQDLNTTFPQMKQQQQAINTPLYIGEFNTQATLLSASTALSVLPSYINALNQNGWSWTMWTYKKLDPADGRSTIWGLFTNNSPWNQANPYSDPFDVLQAKFSAYDTSNLQIQIPILDSLVSALYSVTASGTPAFSAAGFTNAASFLSSSAAPGSIMTIFGVNLMTNVNGIVGATRVPLPVQLAGTSVTVGGVLAPMFAVANINGAQQINLQVPFQVASQNSVSIVVNNSGVSSAPLQVPVVAAQPGVFTVDGVNGAILHPDYSLVTSSKPAAKGEIVLVYATGLGAVNNSPGTGQTAGSSPLSDAILTPRVTVAGAPANIRYGGLAPGFVGLDQINVEIPQNVGSGSLDLQIISPGASSKTVKIAVQ